MKKSVSILATLALVALVASPVARADQAAAQKAGCLACHSVDKKLVGPAFKDVAAKYQGQADAVAKLTDKVRKGGAGVWGQIPMPPNPEAKINDAELKTVVEWILKG